MEVKVARNWPEAKSILLKYRLSSDKVAVELAKGYYSIVKAITN
jgi:hypothetical protein